MKISILFSILFFPLTILGQKLNLEINADNAISTFKFLSTQDTSYVTASQILKFESTKGMITHDGQFDDNLNVENFVKEITNPNTPTNAFRFKQIRNKLTSIKTTIGILTDSINSLTNKIEKKLTPYAIELYLKPIKVFLILGGNSDGYTTDGNTFYLELQFFDDDIDGMANIITHELYHIIQQRSYSPNKNIYEKLNSNEKAKYQLLQSLYMEGSATFIANPLTINQGKKYIRFQQDKYKRNIEKITESFYLFESLLTMADSKNMKEDLIYNLGYGSEWDSPLYFVGYEICREMENRLGKYYIKKFSNISPINFLTEYIDLYSKFPDIKNKFSKQTETMIFNLKKKLNQIGNHKDYTNSKTSSP